MTILVVSHKYPPSIGGMQKQCFELVESLKKKHTVIEHIYRSKGSNVAFLFPAALKTLKILKKNPDIDIIYANDGLMSFFLTPVFWFTKKPIVVTIHGLDVVFPLKFYQRWVKKYLNRTSAVIGVSEATCQEVMKRGVDSSKVHFVANGMDTRRDHAEANFKLSHKIGLDLTNKQVLISIGRGVRRKGFSWFAKHVLPELPQNVIYIVIGPSLGDHQKYIRQQRRLPKSLSRLLALLNGTPLDEITLYKVRAEKNLEERVYHLTDLNNEEVASALKQAQLFVMPNLHVPGDYEGFGLVALEAVRSGLLCLASEVDGIPSAIQHQKNGILLPSEKSELWRTEIIKHLENDTERIRLAEKYRTFAFENCSSWASMAVEYERIFEKVVNK